MTARAVMIRRVCSLVLLVLVVSPACENEPASAAEAVNLLSRMVEAEKTLSYEGIMTWSGHAFGRDFTTRHLVMRYPGGPSVMYREPKGRRMRMWSGAGRDRGFGGGQVMWRGRLPWLRDRDLLLSNYTVKEQGRETVAERLGVVIALESKYEGRPMLRLVVDEETGLLLASTHLDYERNPCFHASFDTLILSPELPERPPKPASPGWGRWPRTGEGHAPAELSFTPLLPSELPEGFVEKWRWPQHRRGESLRVVYSDGLSWIELCQSTAEEGAEEHVVRRRRCGSRTSMKVVVGGIAIRLEGEIEPGTLLSMLESLGPEQ